MEVRTGTQPGLETEMKAIRAINRALETIPLQTQTRVMRYVAERMEEEQRRERESEWARQAAHKMIGSLVRDETSDVKGNT